MPTTSPDDHGADSEERLPLEAPPASTDPLESSVATAEASAVKPTGSEGFQLDGDGDDELDGDGDGDGDGGGGEAGEAPAFAPPDEGEPTGMAAASYESRQVGEPSANDAGSVPREAPAQEHTVAAGTRWEEESSLAAEGVLSSAEVASSSAKTAMSSSGDPPSPSPPMAAASSPHGKAGSPASLPLDRRTQAAPSPPHSPTALSDPPVAKDSSSSQVQRSRDASSPTPAAASANSSAAASAPPAVADASPSSWPRSPQPAAKPDADDGRPAASPRPAPSRKVPVMAHQPPPPIPRAHREAENKPPSVPTQHPRAPPAPVDMSPPSPPVVSFGTAAAAARVVSSQAVSVQASVATLRAGSPSQAMPPQADASAPVAPMALSVKREQDEDEGAPPPAVGNPDDAASHDPEDLGGAPSGEEMTRTWSETIFPMKLYDILCNPDFHHAISWMPHGRSWKVLNKDFFMEEICPQYFAQTRYESFIRQVNGWGFKRMRREGPDRSSYYHEHFLRGYPNMIDHMRRPAPGEKSRDLREEPDFYTVPAMPQLPPPDPGRVPKAYQIKKVGRPAGSTVRGMPQGGGQLHSSFEAVVPRGSVEGGGGGMPQQGPSASGQQGHPSQGTGVGAGYYMPYPPMPMSPYGSMAATGGGGGPQQSWPPQAYPGYPPMYPGYPPMGPPGYYGQGLTGGPPSSPWRPGGPGGWGPPGGSGQQGPSGGDGSGPPVTSQLGPQGAPPPGTSIPMPYPSYPPMYSDPGQYYAQQQAAMAAAGAHTSITPLGAGGAPPSTPQHQGRHTPGTPKREREGDDEQGASASKRPASQAGSAGLHGHPMHGVGDGPPGTPGGVPPMGFYQYMPHMMGSGDPTHPAARVGIRLGPPPPGGPPSQPPRQGGQDEGGGPPGLGPGGFGRGGGGRGLPPSGGSYSGPDYTSI